MKLTGIQHRFHLNGRRLTGGLALIFALSLLTTPLQATQAPGRPVQTLPLPTATVAGRDLSEEIKQNQQRLEAKRAEVQALRNQGDRLREQLADLEAENERVEAQQARLTQQLDYARETVEQRLEEQNQAQERLKQQQAQYQKRISTMFYYRSRSWWEVLLTSNGLEGFFSNLRMIEAIARADQSLLESLKHSQEIADQASQQAQRTAAAYESFLQEKSEQIEKLKLGIIDKQSEAEGLNEALQQRGTEEQDLERTLAEQQAAQAIYEENSRQLAAQIAKIEQQNKAILEQAAKEAQAQQQTPSQSGQPEPGQPGQPGQPALPGGGPSLAPQPMPLGPTANHPKPVWPIPGSFEVWSPYGYRTLGFDASNGYVHTGVDLSSPQAAGSPVVAAWTGVVVTAQAPSQGQMYSPNANYVQINHGGGLGSGYWHLLDVTVSVGQVVQAGQVIGHCGSTGMSTGPHLHFEVYDENNPKRGIRNTCDPLPYLK